MSIEGEFVRKVLVVDDDQGVRDEVGDTLRAAGFKTAIVPNGRWALASLQDNPDTMVVIVDLRMPEMDGFALMSAIEDHFASVIRPAMVVLSGHLDKCAAKSAVQGGALDCLTKPVSRGSLVDSVQSAADMIVKKRTALRQRQTLRHLVGDLNSLFAGTAARLGATSNSFNIPEQGTVGDGVAVARKADDSAPQQLARLLRERESRRDFFPVSPKAEQAPEMMLELALNHFSGRITYLSSLAVGAQLPVSTCTRQLETLEAKGLVERFPDPADRRRVRVRLTDLGAKRVRDYLSSIQ